MQTVTIVGNVAANQCNFVFIGTGTPRGSTSIGGNVSITNCTSPGIPGVRPFAADIDHFDGIGGNVVCSGNASCDIDHIGTGGVGGVVGIRGNLTVDNNGSSSTPENVLGNVTVGGNVEFSGNTGSVNVVASNTIESNLKCFNNTPPPSSGVAGVPADNTVAGHTSGQCVGI